MRTSFYDFCAESGNENLLREWDAELNGDLTPQAVSHGSTREVWWRCEKGHFWRSPIRFQSGRERGCPYCANKKVLAGYNDLATRFPELGRQWHPTLNGDLVPERIVYGSCRKVWWQCEDGHVWKTSAYKRTKKSVRPAARFAPGKRIKIGQDAMTA